MAKRKRHSPEQIVRKLQTADELAAGGAAGDEIARQLGISTRRRFTTGDYINEHWA